MKKMILFFAIAIFTVGLISCNNSSDPTSTTPEVYPRFMVSKIQANYYFPNDTNNIWFLTNPTYGKISIYRKSRYEEHNDFIINNDIYVNSSDENNIYAFNYQHSYFDVSNSTDTVYTLNNLNYNCKKVRVFFGSKDDNYNLYFVKGLGIVKFSVWNSDPITATKPYFITYNLDSCFVK